MTSSCTYTRSSGHGFTLIELLASLALSGILFASAFGFFADVSWRARDTGIHLSTWKEATHVTTLIASEIRLAGAGVPISQTDFTPGTAGLGDKPLGILTTSTASRLTFRTARGGILRTVMSDYAPTTTNLVVTLNSTIGISAGDEIYLSNLSRGGSGALWGTITAVTSTQVTIRNDFIRSSSATFAAGSSLQVVDTLTYENQNRLSGITRTDNATSLVIASNADLRFEYLDRNLTPLPLPLTDSAVQNQLTAIRLTLSLGARQKMKLKQSYSTSITHLVALRNLLI